MRFVIGIDGGLFLIGHTSFAVFAVQSEILCAFLAPIQVVAPLIGLSSVDVEEINWTPEMLNKLEQHPRPAQAKQCTRGWVNLSFANIP